MTIGFIGTGGITTAMVTGLCSAGQPPESIWVSPRNKENAARLASTYEAVAVAASNQEVVDNADLIVLAVLPQQGEKILSPLTFRGDQTIVHLLAGTRIEQVSPLVAPATEIIRAVPLPCTAIRKGPIAIYPDHDRVSAFFDPLGTVIALDREAQLETLSIITSLMAPYYALVAQVTAWAAGEGIDREKGAAYTAAMFGALSTIAETTPGGDIQALADGCMTPGGLNELAMKVINDRDGFAGVAAALEAVKRKIA